MWWVRFLIFHLDSFKVWQKQEIFQILSIFPSSENRESFYAEQLQFAFRPDFNDLFRLKLFGVVGIDQPRKSGGKFAKENLKMCFPVIDFSMGFPSLNWAWRIAKRDENKAEENKKQQRTH